MVPNGKAFVDSLNVLDCSKVSDGASAIAIVSEEGLKRCGIPKDQAVQVMGFAQVERNITNDPPDKTELTTIKKAAHRALEMAGITINDLGTIEVHDCFSIAGVLSTEALDLLNQEKVLSLLPKGILPVMEKSRSIPPAD